MPELEIEALDLLRAALQLSPPSPPAPADGARRAGCGAGRCRRAKTEAQERPDGEQRRGGESALLQPGPGLLVCWESQPRDIVTSQGSGSGAASMVSAALPVPQAASLLLPQSPAKLGGDSHGLQCLDISSLARAPPSLASSHFYCPNFSPYKSSSFKPSKTQGLSQCLPCSSPPTTQKEGNEGSQHVPVTVNAVKPRWLRGVGCQSLRVLRCSPESDSRLGSLGLERRKESRDKQAVCCDCVTAALSEAPIALDKLMRTKLSILASLPHRTTVPVAQVGWYIMGDLVLPGLAGQSHMVPHYLFA